MSRAKVRSPHNLSATFGFCANSLARSTNLCLFCSHRGPAAVPALPMRGALHADLRRNPGANRSGLKRLISHQRKCTRMSRLYLTAREYEALLKQQNGKCCVDDCDASDVSFIGEHSTPQSWRHGKPDQLMCAACHKVKTLRDIKAIWKVKRLNGAALSQYERRRRYSSKLRGRPFEQPHQNFGAPPWKR